MKNYKDNFLNVINFAVEKSKTKWWKLILLGVMGAIYVGIAYVAFILIVTKWPGNIEYFPPDPITGIKKIKEVTISGSSLVTGGAVFTVGIILITFLGGSLFTSDNLSSIACFIKKAKIKSIVMKWFLTLLGNLIGGIIIAGIIRASDIFSSEETQAMLGSMIGGKIKHEWWATFFSGILCNVIVAGTVWASLAAKHSSAKLFIVFFPIWLFVIVGFQHVVANAILFFIGMMYSIDPSDILVLNKWISESAGYVANHGGIKGIGWWYFDAFFFNLIPSMIGNWLSGAILLPVVYFFLSGYNEKYWSKKKKVGTSLINMGMDNIVEEHPQQCDTKNLENKNISSRYYLEKNIQKNKQIKWTLRQENSDTFIKLKSKKEGIELFTNMSGNDDLELIFKTNDLTK